ncbi:MAG: glycosyltransferase family 39 protein [Thermoflexales bacterium]|nr:glycosyltransferase family 39 protein [Thermoflexales bacterium]
MRVPQTSWRAVGLIVSLSAAGLAFAESSDNTFRPLGVAAWGISVIAFAVALLDRPVHWRPALARGEWLALLAVLLIGAWFRFYQLDVNPREMNSDHAEKLLDVHDVLEGRTAIFFERNTGREPFQFYWTAALIHVSRLLPSAWSLAPDFMALKIGTAVWGLLSLPAVYGLARMLFGARAAMFAALFAAVASWGVLAQRFGLRAGIHTTMAAWVLFWLVRAVRTNKRNDFLALGLSLGLALLGYIPARVLPLVIALFIGARAAQLWVQRSSELAQRLLMNAGVSLWLAGLVVLPLARYALERPHMVFYRVATRLAEAEKPIEGNPLLIFADNMWRALLMFHITRDETWVTNLPDRPVLDPLLGALLVLGLVLVIGSSKWRRMGVLVVLAIAILLLPSALSLAFPRENPSAIRTLGALPFVMTLCAVPLGWGLELTQRWRVAHLAAWLVVLGISAAVVALNAQRVFVDYPAQYCPRAQNASDIAQVMREALGRGVPRQNVWLVGYPHWVDHRAVGVWLGDIRFNNVAGASVGLTDAALAPLAPGRAVFVLHPADARSLSNLLARFPQGRYRLFEGSQCDGREFLVFEVSADETAAQPH